MSEENNNKSEQKEEGKEKDTGMITTSDNGISICCLPIIGQIEGHYLLSEAQKSTKYEHIIPLLVAAERDEKTDGLLVILNTIGGDVEAGLALAELISSMSKPTVSLVLGGGHSIGVPLAVSAKRSFIVESATMTLHPVRMNGLVVGVPQSFNYFERMQERIEDFIERNSRIHPAKLRELMMKTGEMATDVGTILNGREAVESGIIDSIGGLSDALSALYDLIRKSKKNV